MARAPLVAPADVSPPTWCRRRPQWTCLMDSYEMWCSPTPTPISQYRQSSFRNIGILACPFGVPTARQCDNRQRTSVRLLVRPFPESGSSFIEMLTTAIAERLTALPAAYLEPTKPCGDWFVRRLCRYSLRIAARRTNVGASSPATIDSGDCLTQGLSEGISVACSVAY